MTRAQFRSLCARQLWGMRKAGRLYREACARALYDPQT